MPVAPRRRPVRIWLIIATLLGLPAVPVGGFMALMSVMLFDSPGSERNAAVILFFISMVAFPLACIAGIVMAWIAFGRGRDRRALWLSLLPLIPVVTGILAAVWMEVAHNGRLAP